MTFHSTDRRDLVDMTTSMVQELQGAKDVTLMTSRLETEQLIDSSASASASRRAELSIP